VTKFPGVVERDTGVAGLAKEGLMIKGDTCSSSSRLNLQRGEEKDGFHFYPRRRYLGARDGGLLFLLLTYVIYRVMF